jgi:hypothetical protein
LFIDGVKDSVSVEDIKYIKKYENEEVYYG